MLRLEVRDDGAGGADPDGHGLVGMRDMVTTLGGRLAIESPRRRRHARGRHAAALGRLAVRGSRPHFGNRTLGWAGIAQQPERPAARSSGPRG